MNVLAIDPGSTESAYCVIDADERLPNEFCKIDNRELLEALHHITPPETLVAIEMVASYGMPVGADVFETCVWVGRFAHELEIDGRDVKLVFRRDIKLHHCHSAKAKDSNITQALIDRFAPGVPNRGKGTKQSPGFFYGFKADVWQAYALAVYVADREKGLS